MYIGRRFKHAMIVLVAFSCATGCLWYSISWVPKHLLRRICWATVNVDGHAANADVYMGHPTGEECEAYVLVHVPSAGDYFLNFDNESYREASEYEYIRTKRLLWFFKPMQEGSFKLPPQAIRINTYMIVSHGHSVEIQF
jgi:hypothetical protein